ncbi:MAG: MMPL family transporter, partial [Sphaerochaetaceae bacterium]|nr:MMPL family transporter [Sphaerochaetaceae bacterium]
MKKKRLTDAMILVIFCIASIISLLLVGTITVDSSTEAFMPQEAPVVQINEELEQRFGSTDAIVIGLSTRFGSILHPQYLATIDGMTERVSGIAGVGQAISITNADHISASNEGIQIVSLYDPESDRSLSSMKQYLDDWPEFYQSNLIAADESMASIIVQPQSGLSAFATEKILAEIRTIVDATDQDSLDIAIIGLPVIKSEINRSLVSDIIVLAPIVAVIIIIVLIIAFRHVSAVVLSMITLVIAVALTVGTIALLDITFTMATMLVPVLLVIVGSAYSIHVMSHFQKEVNKHTSFIPPEEIGRIVSKIIRNNKTPIIMAGATTAAGFIAQLFSPLQPFRTFGLLCAFGVLLSQITSLIILPILLRLTYRNGMRITQSSQRTSKIRSNHWNLLIRVNQQHRLIILSLFILLIFAMIVSVFRIPVGTDLLSFFKDNTKLVNDTKLFNDKMGGSGVLAVAIEADTPGSIMTPSFLTTISEFETIIQDDPAVGKIQSIIPYVERINRTINWDSIPYRPSSYSTETAEFDFFSIDDNSSIASSTEELLTSEHATEEQLISRQDFNSSL